MQIVLADILYKTDKRVYLEMLFKVVVVMMIQLPPMTMKLKKKQIESMKSIYLKRLYLFISTPTPNQIKNYNKFCHFVFQFMPFLV